MEISNDQNTYTIIFNSQGSNVLASSNNNCYVSYDINWNNILPTKYKKFKCNFTFRSANYKVNNYNYTNCMLFDSGLVNINFGSKSLTYQNIGNNTYNIGMIYPDVFICHTNNLGAIIASIYTSCYCAKTNTNNSFTIGYPTNSQVNIIVYALSNNFTPLPNFQHYVMYLTLTGIQE